MTPEDRTLVTVGRAAQMLRVTRQAIRWFVDTKQLEVFCRLETHAAAQMVFRKSEVRRLVIQRSERRTRRPPSRWTPGSQLELTFPVEQTRPASWRLIRPQMLKRNLSLKRRLEIEGRAKARLVDRQVKPIRTRKDSSRVA
jgi:hypothetical protein